VIVALLAAACLAAPGEGTRGDQAHARIMELFQAVAREPEPPPGLRAPPMTERHRRAREQYRASIGEWRRAERERRTRLILLCTRFLEAETGSRRAREVRYVRGVTHFQAGRFEQAGCLLPRRR
jgi:hypothetical protein